MPGVRNLDPVPSVPTAVRPDTRSRTPWTITTITTIRSFTTVVIAALTLAACDPPWASTAPEPEPGGAAMRLHEVVDLLRVEPEPPRAGYARERFEHWEDVNGSGCRARADVLADQALGQVQRDPAPWCVIVEGDWYSAFDGVRHSGHPSEIDVDHVVALAEAWDSGASEWSNARRRQFANDPLNLLVATRRSNQDKADLDAGEWRPERRDAWCITATMITLTKLRYDLSVDPAERNGLVALALECDRDTWAPASYPLPGTAPFDDLVLRILDERAAG